MDTNIFTIDYSLEGTDITHEIDAEGFLVVKTQGMTIRSAEKVTETTNINALALAMRSEALKIVKSHEEVGSMSDKTRQELMEEFDSMLSGFLKSSGEIYLTKTEHGFETEIYADYDNEIEDSTIAEILESEHPMEAFNEKMNEWYLDSEWDIIDKIHEECKNEESLILQYEKMQEQLGKELTMDFEDYLRDSINELVSVNYPYDHYLKQEVCVDIVVDSGDATYDFTCNNILNYYGEGKCEIDKNSSIAWLCEQQGKKELFEKTIKELKGEDVLNKKSDNIKIEGHVGTWYVIDTAIHNGRELFLLEHEDYGDETASLIVDADKNIVLDDVWNGFLDYEEAFDIESEEMQFGEDKFIDSVVQELENLPSHMGALTFCVSMTLKELIDVNEKINNKESFSLTIDKSAECGLYDLWSGGGSVLEIELDKDVVIPSNMLNRVCPDKSLPWHGIHEVYGVSNSLWRASVSVTEVSSLRWRVIDNYHETILPEQFDTEVLATAFMNEKIASNKALNESYDYDVALLSATVSYKEYTEGLENADLISKLNISIFDEPYGRERMNFSNLGMVNGCMFSVIKTGDSTLHINDVFEYTSNKSPFLKNIVKANQENQDIRVSLSVDIDRITQGLEAKILFTGKDRAEEIAKEIQIEWENFEPTDSEGKEMEGSVVYNGKEYNVDCSWYVDESYELQIAKQIQDVISPKLSFPLLLNQDEKDQLIAIVEAQIGEPVKISEKEKDRNSTLKVKDKVEKDKKSSFTFSKKISRNTNKDKGESILSPFL